MVCYNENMKKIVFYMNKYSLLELRKIAARIGAHSPTSLSKPALIEEIIRLLTTGERPAPKSNAGRPSRNLIVHEHEAEHIDATIAEMKQILSEEPDIEVAGKTTDVAAWSEKKKDHPIKKRGMPMGTKRQLILAHLRCLKLSLGVSDNKVLLSMIQTVLKEHDNPGNT
jgi:hypothetical protein